jgi:hypothetical protein
LRATPCHSPPAIILLPLSGVVCGCSLICGALKDARTECCGALIKLGDDRNAKAPRD